MNAEIVAIRRLKKKMLNDTWSHTEVTNLGEEGVGAGPDHSRPVDSHDDAGLLWSVLLQMVLDQQDISVHV